MRQEITPVADYTVLYRAVEIDAAIGEWRLPSRDNDAGDPIGQIYKQMPQIYLWQTTQIGFLGAGGQNNFVSQRWALPT
jgi:hypothetical protein